MTGVDRAMSDGAVCTCVELKGCDEFDSECLVCSQRDAYDPCPEFGFGCGSQATESTPKCDCCTSDQWHNARKHWT